MTWTIATVQALMDTWYPPSMAEEWDRVGLIVGDPSTPIRRILLAVDPVAATIQQAVDTDTNLIITHHPLYLRGTSFVPANDPKGALVTALIRNGIGLFNAHTNADIATSGVSEALANLLGLTHQHPLVPTGIDTEGSPVGHGRIGRVQRTTVANFAQHVADVLPAGPHGLFIGGDGHMTVETVAVSGGAGDSFLSQARATGADVFVTADLRHHPASEHLEGGKPALLAGSHWATEWPWLPVLAARLRQAAARDGVQVSVEVSTIVTEPWNDHLRTGGTL